MKVQNLATCLGRKGRSCCRVSWGLEGRDTKALTDRDHTWRADKWEGQNAGKLGFCFLHRAGVGKARGEVKPLVSLIKKQREKNKINKIRNENGEITTDNTEMQRIMRLLSATICQ